MRTPLVGESLRWLCEAGHDVTPLLDRFRLPATATSDKEVWVAPSQLGPFLDAVAATLQEPSLGLRLATRMKRGTFGLAEFAIRASPTVSEVLRRIAAYISLVNAVAMVTFEPQDASARLTHRLKGYPCGAGRHDNEFTLALVALNISQRTRGQAIPQEVAFAHPAGESRDDLRTMLGVTKIRFGADCNALVYARASLECAIESSDPELLAVLDEQAQRILSDRPVPVSFVAQVREAVYADLGPCGPTLRHVARRLSMSTRALQRRLAQEQAAFREVVDSVRAEVACAHLAAPQTSLSELAAELGYADLGGFVRAFKRWTGHTPAAYRQRRGLPR